MDNLKLQHQLCFPLYALSRQVTGIYRPILEKFDLTYPQYLVMLVLWEHEQLSVKDIGHLLWLDSGTLTPLLKRLEQKGLLTRQRDKQDERLVQVMITHAGKELKEDAAIIPASLREGLPISEEDARKLIQQLHLILNKLSENKQ